MFADTGIDFDTWVLAHDPANTLKSEGERYGVDAARFYGFLYVDPQAGATLHVESFCNVLEDGTIQPTDGPARHNQRVILRYETFAGFELTPLTAAQRRALSLPDQPEWLRSYPASEEVRALRRERLLHPLRAPGFPDDIKFLLMPQKDGQNPEAVWGRLVRQHEAALFECVLLNQPDQDFALSRNAHVLVHVRQVEAGTIAVCVARLTD